MIKPLTPLESFRHVLKAAMDPTASKYKNDGMRFGLLRNKGSKIAHVARLVFGDAGFDLPLACGSGSREMWDVSVKDVKAGKFRVCNKCKRIDTRTEHNKGAVAWMKKMEVYGNKGEDD